MSSAKSAVNRLLVSRWGVVFVALAVLATGCSQSEDSVSDGSGSATNTSRTRLSYTAPPSPVTQASVQKESSVSGLEIATTTISLSSPDARNALSEEAVGLIDGMVDACADLLEFRCARALDDVCFKIANSRVDLLGAGSTEKVDGRYIFDIRKLICHLKDTVHMWEFDAVLSAKYGVEYYSELNPGFFAFRHNFRQQRRTMPFVERYVDVDGNVAVNALTSMSFEEFIANSSWDGDMPSAIRLKLSRLVYDLAFEAISATGAAEPMDEDVSSRILDAQRMSESGKECYHYENGIQSESFADLLLKQPGWSYYVGEVMVECIENLCETRRAIEDFICYFEGRIVDEATYDEAKYTWHMESGREVTVVSLFWKALKYFCAIGEIDHNTDPTDSCHGVAANICDVMGVPGIKDASASPTIIVSFTYISRDLSTLSPCELAVELSSLPYSNAISECFDQVKVLLTTPDSILVPDRACTDASNKCEEFYEANEHYFKGRIGSLDMYYPSKECWGYRQFYDYLLTWNNLFSPCSEDDSLLAFVDSECYNYIRRFCDSTSNDTDLVYFTTRMNNIDSRFVLRARIRHPSYAKGIRSALCVIIADTRKIVIHTLAQTSTMNNSISKYLPHTLEEAQRIAPNPVGLPIPGNINVMPARKKIVFTPLSDVNINLINSATQACLNQTLSPRKSECEVKLQRSCFDLLFSSSESTTLHESLVSDINLAADYVCSTVWIAELGRIASVLSANFPDDYQAGNFNRFIRYIARQACYVSLSAVNIYGGGIFSIDENGKARPKRSILDKLSNRSSILNEIIPPLITSVAQYVQPYLQSPDTEAQSCL